MTDTYQMYCSWCIDNGREPPSRAWWEANVVGTRAGGIRCTCDFAIDSCPLHGRGSDKGMPGD